MYYNTTNIAGQPLQEAKSKAKTQSAQILSYLKECYRANGGNEKRSRRTPSEVYIFFGKKWLLTSVRRTMSTLSNDKEPTLTKLKEKKTSPYGRPEHYWIYKPQPVSGEQGELF